VLEILVVQVLTVLQTIVLAEDVRQNQLNLPLVALSLHLHQNVMVTLVHPRVSVFQEVVNHQLAALTVLQAAIGVLITNAPHHHNALVHTSA